MEKPTFDVNAVVDLLQRDMLIREIRKLKAKYTEEQWDEIYQKFVERRT